ncbi:hypothetical protein CRUP_012499 [Coryphaenoides rupestris]|nr:hypothetical protein CRUP_012499 [Coryphaenoides rupestris]
MEDEAARGCEFLWTMDFLSLFAVYVLLVLGTIGLSSSQRCFHQLFHQRSRAFIFLHLLLELLVYGEFSYEVFGFCREMDTTLGSLAVPYVLLALKTRLFYLCITSDPARLQSSSQRCFHQLFHQRSRAFIFLHLLLELLVYGEFSYEVFGFCREMDTTLGSLAVPYVLLALKTRLFYLCITSDPGTVTPAWVTPASGAQQASGAGQLRIYPYDGRMFHPGVLCPTCRVVKPARSKHCRVCDRCVHRFDHHCVWLNNCVGAQNARYFLLYLLSVCSMAGSVALLTGDMLLHATLRSGLLSSSYLDRHGQRQPAGPLFVIQHLFLTFPRIVFMLGFLLLVLLLLSGYGLFHGYLLLVNQTSNEWSKSRGLACRRCRSGQSADGFCGPAPDPPRRHFYSRGVWRNLAEICFPFRPAAHKVD